jgi:hypothetical protein
MNFYLSAVDDQLRHETDRPSSGIILCQGRNEVVVEYALRDTAKPMGVAQYRIATALPDLLQAELPTPKDLAREFPLMSVIKLHLEIEREVRRLLVARGLEDPTAGIGTALSELRKFGVAPASAKQFYEAFEVMNRAVHGLEPDSEVVQHAVALGSAFLADLRRLAPDESI